MHYNNEEMTCERFPVIKNSYLYELWQDVI